VTGEAVDVRYTGHARGKFELLARYGVRVSPTMVEDTIRNPDTMMPDPSGGGRTIAQRRMSDRHVLRVVFRREDNVAVVITFYPGRRSRYETAV